MKKLLALLLAMIMVFNLNIVASAAEDEDIATQEALDPSTWISKEVNAAVYFAVKYVINGSTDESIYPEETLTFTSTPDESNPDSTNITIDNLVVAGNKNQYVPINLPSYKSVGDYKYIITLNPGNTQGVTYSREEIAITVSVDYDHENSCLIPSIFLSAPNSGGGLKKDTFTSTYDVGTVSISKTVTGSLVDSSKDFTFHATLQDSYGKAIAFPASATIENVDDAEFSADRTTITFSLKHTEKATLQNIPVGAILRVTEADGKYTVKVTQGKNILGKPIVLAESDDTAEFTAADSVVKLENDTIQFINTLSETSLTIRKVGGNTGESFVMNVTGAGLNTQVVVPANGSVTIHGLKCGETYTVTEDTAWAWRYTSNTARIKLDSDGQENIVTITNTLNSATWLSGDSANENCWDASGNVHSIK